MRASPTLLRYIGRQFLLWFGLLLGGLLLLVLLLDTVELLRRAANRPNVPLGLVLEMGLLKLPGIGQKMFPFAILFAAMFTFWKLTRSQELVVARAVGISAWQFLAPVLTLALVIGVLEVMVVNPIGSVLVARYDKLEEQYLKGRSGAFNLLRSGLWLRQVGDKEQYVIHAESVVPGRAELRQVIFFRFRGNTYIGRIDAPVTRLVQGNWQILESWFNRPNMPPEFQKVRYIPTDLTLAKIQESFAPPEAMSFWELPRFIQTLQDTGFSAVRHRMHYQSLLAQPLLLCAMVLFAAAFSLRQTRRGGTLAMISGGLFTGFALFVMSDVIKTIGLSETIPVLMAAWTPAGISLLLGTTLLLHLEDG